MSRLTFGPGAKFTMGYTVWQCPGCGSQLAQFGDADAPARCSFQWGDQLPCGSEYARVITVEPTP